MAAADPALALFVAAVTCSHAILRLVAWLLGKLRQPGRIHLLRPTDLLGRQTRLVHRIGLGCRHECHRTAGSPSAHLP